jgi:hypothetical protein
MPKGKRERSERSDNSEGTIKNAIIVGLVIALFMLSLFAVIRPPACNQNFPAERMDWCTEEGYYIGALDEIFYSAEIMKEDGHGYTEAYKDIVMITIDYTYNFDDPPVEVYGSLYFWNDMWDYESELYFPFHYFDYYAAPLVPVTYNDYSVTEDLLFESLANAIENFEGNATVINFTISHNERLVTMTQEADTPLPFLENTDIITVGYFYGVDYVMEVWVDYPPMETIYLRLEVVSECNSGIPLFQSLIFTTYVTGLGCVACSIFSLKTIATSFALTEV